MYPATDHPFIGNPDDVRSLSRLASDLRHILEDEGYPGLASLHGAPLLDCWCETLAPQRAIIGLSGLDAPMSRIATPIVAMSRRNGWVRSLSGWYRLGRQHIDGTC